MQLLSPHFMIVLRQPRKASASDRLFAMPVILKRLFGGHVFIQFYCCSMRLVNPSGPGLFAPPVGPKRLPAGLSGWLGCHSQQGGCKLAVPQWRGPSTAALRDGFDRLGKSDDAGISNLVVTKVKFLALRQRGAPQTLITKDDSSFRTTPFSSAHSTYVIARLTFLPCIACCSRRRSSSSRFTSLAVLRQ